MLSTEPSTSDCAARRSSPTTPDGSRSRSQSSLIASPPCPEPIARPERCRDAKGHQVRPCRTVVLNDHSCAVVGYTLSFGAPSAEQTALAVLQTINARQIQASRQLREVDLDGGPAILATSRLKNLTQQLARKAGLSGQPVD